MQVLVLWVLPAKLTLTLLAFTFDYLPHRPHQQRLRAGAAAANAVCAAFAAALAEPCIVFRVDVEFELGIAHVLSRSVHNDNDNDNA